MIKTFNPTNVIFFIVLLLLDTPVWGQKGELTVNVQFKILELGINSLDKRIDPVFKFYLGKENGTLINGTGACYKFFSKASTNNFILPDPKYPGWENLQRFNIPILSSSSFTITMECFANNKGEACTYDKKDAFHSITEKIIDLNNYTPGDYSDTFRITDNNNHFWSKVEFRYTLVAPGKIKPDALQDVNVADGNVVLHTSYDLVNKDKLKFTWEYSDDKGASWNRLPVPRENPFTVTLNPLRDLFGGQLTSTQQVLFRFRVNSRDTFAVSDTLKTLFAAVPPSFDKSEVKAEQTCKGYENGALTIGHIQSVKNKALYVLRKASESKSACNFLNPSASTCPGLVKSGEITHGALELKRLAADDYTLILYNPDEQIGNVYTAYDFQIQPFEDLNLKNISFRNPNCNDDLAGQIVINASGGSYPDQWQITLSPSNGVQEFNKQEKQISFKQLPEGNYTVEVQDGCGVPQTKNITLKKPDKLIIESIKVRPAPDEALILTLKNGSGRYRAIISDRNQYVKEYDSLVNYIIPISGKGTFSVQIFDKTDPACLSVDTTITVAGNFNDPVKNIQNKILLIAKTNDVNTCNHYALVPRVSAALIAEVRKKRAHRS